MRRTRLSVCLLTFMVYMIYIVICICLCCKFRSVMVYILCTYSALTFASEHLQYLLKNTRLRHIKYMKEELAKQLYFLLIICTIIPTNKKMNTLLQTTFISPNFISFVYYSPFPSYQKYFGTGNSSNCSVIKIGAIKLNYIIIRTQLTYHKKTKKGRKLINTRIRNMK